MRRTARSDQPCVSHRRGAPSNPQAPHMPASTLVHRQLSPDDQVGRRAAELAAIGTCVTPLDVAQPQRPGAQKSP